MGHFSLDFHGFWLESSGEGMATSLAEREWQPGPTCYHTVVRQVRPGQVRQVRQSSDRVRPRRTASDRVRDPIGRDP
eukprot:6213081-Prymnesium_polylepis.1